MEKSEWTFISSLQFSILGFQSFEIPLNIFPSPLSTSSATKEEFKYFKEKYRQKVKSNLPSIARFHFHWCFDFSLPRGPVNDSSHFCGFISSNLHGHHYSKSSSEPNSLNCPAKFSLLSGGNQWSTCQNRNHLIPLEQNFLTNWTWLPFI